MFMFSILIFFFFKQKTAYEMRISDWSSDVCSSDLTPHVVTAITGFFVALTAAFLPVGKLADISNSGTLFAFFMVALSVMILRRTDPTRHRPFRTPAVWIVAPLAVVGCVGLYASLPSDAKIGRAHV